MTDKVEAQPTERDKLQFQTYMKLKCYCLGEKITLDQITILIIKCMHEYNKMTLLGRTKRKMTIDTIMLIISELASEPIKDIITEEFISDVIEQVYRNGYHRRVWKKSKCNII